MTRLEQYIAKLQNKPIQPDQDEKTQRPSFQTRSRRSHVISTAQSNDNEAPIHQYLKKMELDN